jgi:RimJ/RimL family protein N-acetyltransferase
VTVVPVLATERLILRGWRAEDFGFYAEHMADPDITRYITPLPTRADAWRSLALVIGHWHVRGYGAWAVAHKEDGTLIGRVGFWHPEGWPAIELIWALGKPYWGQGYATEAARAALAQGFASGLAGRFVSHIDRGNKASAAVAKRLGQRFAGETAVKIAGRPQAVDIWEIGRKAWEARP